MKVKQKKILSKRGVMQNVRWTWKLKDFSHTLLKYSMEKKNFLLREFFSSNFSYIFFSFIFGKPNNGGDGGMHERMIYLMFDSFSVPHSSLLSFFFIFFACFWHVAVITEHSRERTASWLVEFDKTSTLVTKRAPPFLPSWLMSSPLMCACLLRERVRMLHMWKKLSGSEISDLLYPKKPMKYSSKAWRKF